MGRLVLDRWYPNGVGYIRFEAAGGCDLATHKGGLAGAKSENQVIEAWFWLENTD